MAVTQKILYDNDNAPNTLTSVYTVPASTSTNVTCITIVNKTASAAGITIMMRGITVTSLNNTLAAYSTSVIKLAKVLNAADIIQVQASAANAIAVSINGAEVV